MIILYYNGARFSVGVKKTRKYRMFEYIQRQIYRERENDTSSEHTQWYIMNIIIIII